MKYFLIALLTLLMTACGDGKHEAADQLSAAENKLPGIIVDLAPFDMPFSLDLGDLATLGTDSVEVAFNEEFGWLEVRLGERVGLTIAEEPGDLQRLKADLDRDMLQKHTIIAQDADHLVYRSQFPDSDMVYVHFVRVITVDGRTFVMQDAMGPRFTEADVARMNGSVRLKSAA
jgi:hypothetical protein